MENEFCDQKYSLCFPFYSVILKALYVNWMTSLYTAHTTEGKRQQIMSIPRADTGQTRSTRTINTAPSFRGSPSGIVMNGKSDTERWRWKEEA